MSCGRKPLVRNWDKPRNIRFIKPSRYEKNEKSVKIHWKNVIRTLESSYKDEKFWESQTDTVRELVGPKIFRKIAKIFDLPPADEHYAVPPELWSQEPSETFYENVVRNLKSGSKIRATGSVVDFDASMYEDLKTKEEEEISDEEVENWTSASEIGKPARSKSVLRSKSSMFRSMSRYSSRITSYDSASSYLDDLIVQLSGVGKKTKRPSTKQNPHFNMLFCTKSETDMIKWKSKYKQTTFQVSASDEFSKKAEILTKQIAKEFYDWWVELGHVEFKSEIKRPEDIEALFQVWFDEHASRGLVLDHKILPCVLETIANYEGIDKAACPKVLKRQIQYDIHAETSPAHTVAFSTSLPQHLKHIPPKNNTKEMWGPVKVPTDLKTMACVWDGIQHLTSTKAFHKWLQARQYPCVPPILKSLDKPRDLKAPFVVPSDFYPKESPYSSSDLDLELPVSKFTLEIRDVLSKLSI